MGGRRSETLLINAADTLVTYTVFLSQWHKHKRQKWGGGGRGGGAGSEWRNRLYFTGLLENFQVFLHQALTRNGILYRIQVGLDLHYRLPSRPGQLNTGTTHGYDTSRVRSAL